MSTTSVLFAIGIFIVGLLIRREVKIGNKLDEQLAEDASQATVGRL